MRRLSALLLLAALTLTGCTAGNLAGLRDLAGRLAGGQPAGPAESVPPDSEAELPGSYTVPDGWVKAEQYSTADKIFYVEEGHQEEVLPDNISIEVGTNRYGADEYEKFREAIVRQLAAQVSGKDAQLTGSGSYTEQDYILYVFTIDQEEVQTKQYYIVGDRRYCLIHLTNFTGSEEAEEAAQSMADSFVWASEDG